MDYISNKNILITGGTGSIGQSVFLKILNTYSPKSITIFSRDEYKQYKIKSMIQNHNLKHIVNFVIGDIRDYESVERVSRNKDIIFHCAALKHVPISEENPEEFIKTNINGALNLKKAAIDNNVSIVVGVSTDKAVNPTNVMGFTKSLQEKIFSSGHDSGTKFINVRFGNVIDTKGSLFPILAHQIINKQPLTITHEGMTRFFMTKEDAVGLIINSAIVGNNGDTVIKKMNSIKIIDLFNVFLEVYGENSNSPIKNIGIRPGERLNEYLMTYDELIRMKYTDFDGGHFIIPPYLKSEINDNIIINNGKYEDETLYDFASDNPKYFFSTADIRDKISCFKKNQENNFKDII